MFMSIFDQMPKIVTRV